MKRVAGIVEIPGVREDVRVLRTPRGLLFHDPYRWRLFAAPLDLEPGRRAAWLAREGLAEGDPLPPVKARTIQGFWVAREQTPEGPLVAPPGARFSCISCGKSCGGHKLGPLQPADLERLLACDWEGARDPARFFVDDDGAPLEPRPELAGQQRVYLRQENGRCQFLQADNLCGVHARFGARQKPNLCQAFPFSFRATPEGTVATMRLADCHSAERTSLLTLVAEQLDQLREIERGQPEILLFPPTLWLSAERLVRWEEYAALEARLLALPEVDQPDARAPAPLAAAALEALTRLADAQAAQPAPAQALERLYQDAVAAEPPFSSEPPGEAAVDEWPEALGVESAAREGTSSAGPAALAGSGAPAAGGRSLRLRVVGAGSGSGAGPGSGSGAGSGSGSEKGPPLDEAGQRLDAQVVGQLLFGKDLLLHRDLLSAAAQQVVRSAFARRLASELATAQGLPAAGAAQVNQAWAAFGEAPLRYLTQESRLDARAFAAALAIRPSP